jgi:hypothetical protein
VSEIKLTEEAAFMGFEIFTRKIARVASPTISLAKAGRITLNSACTKLFEKEAVEYVLVLWDKEQKTVALRPIRKKDARTYHIHYGKSGSYASFSAKSFLDYIGFISEETRNIPATWNEDENQLEAKIPEEYFKKEATPKPTTVEPLRRTK